MVWHVWGMGGVSAAHVPRVGGVSVAREQLRTRENGKGNEQKEEIMCLLQDSNPQSHACEATVLSPVLL